MQPKTGDGSVTVLFSSNARLQELNAVISPFKFKFCQAAEFSHPPTKRLLRAGESTENKRHEVSDDKNRTRSESEKIQQKSLPDEPMEEQHDHIELVTDPSEYITEVQPDVYLTCGLSCPVTREGKWTDYCETLLERLEACEYCCSMITDSDAGHEGLPLILNPGTALRPPDDMLSTCSLYSIRSSDEPEKSNVSSCVQEAPENGNCLVLPGEAPVETIAQLQKKDNGEAGTPTITAPFSLPPQTDDSLLDSLGTQTIYDLNVIRSHIPEKTAVAHNTEEGNGKSENSEHEDGVVALPANHSILSGKGCGKSAFSENPRIHTSNASQECVPSLHDYDALPVSLPKSLTEVKQRLRAGNYEHPFLFQHAIRLVFAAEFEKNAKDSKAWKDAANACVVFENLCKEIVQVNPYAVFACAKTGHPAKATDSTVNLLAPSIGDHSASTVSLTPTRRRPRNRVPPGVHVRDNGNIVYTAECFGTPLAIHYENNYPAGALPKPCLMPPLTNDPRSITGISNAQKKTLPARFKELDVTYRLALLEWLKDELGIHPILCSLDVRYVPEFDLIPTVKARKFFIYMKALMAQQKDSQEELLVAATLPTILDWTNPDINKVSEAAKPAFDQLSESANVCSSAPSISRACIGERASYTAPNHTNDNSAIGDSIDESSSSSEDSDLPAISETTSTNFQGWSCGPQRFGLGLWRHSSITKPSVPSAPNPSTSWSEWKVKALQKEFKLKEMSNQLAQTEQEARAESANSRI